MLVICTYILETEHLNFEWNHKPGSCTHIFSFIVFKNGKHKFCVEFILYLESNYVYVIVSRIMWIVLFNKIAVF